MGNSLTASSLVSAVTVQFANELKKEGFTFIPIEPGTLATPHCLPVSRSSEQHAASARA